ASMLKRLFAAATVAVAALASGCGITPPAEPARTFIEQVAYWDGQAVGFRKTVDQLTCYAGYGSGGLCLEAGEPIAPAVALQMLEAIKNARGGLRASVTIPEQGVGL